MANNGDLQSSGDASSRTYQTKDVHKRRIDRKARPESTRCAPPPEPPDEKPARDATRTRFIDMPGLLPDDAERPTGGGDTDTGNVPAPEAHSAVVADGAGGAGGAGRAAETGKTTGADDEKTGKLAKLRALIPSPTAKADSGGNDAVAEPRESAARVDADVPEGAPSETTRPQPAGKPEGEAPGAGEEPKSAPRKRKRAKTKPPMRTGFKVALIAAAIVVVAIAVVGGLYGWNRWLRYDDAADMQGEWYVAGTAVPITIDTGTMYLTDDVAYTYELDTHDKRIRYTFGPMEGQGTYWFGGERQFLVIADDGSETARTPLDDFAETLLGTGATSATQLPKGEGIIAFNRKPAPLALAKQVIVSHVLSQAAAADAEARRIAEEQAEAEAAEQAAYYGYYY